MVQYMVGRVYVAGSNYLSEGGLHGIISVPGFDIMSQLSSVEADWYG